MGRRAQQQASQGQKQKGLGKHNQAGAAGPKNDERHGEAHPQRQAEGYMEGGHQTRVSAHSKGEQCKEKCKHPQAPPQVQKGLQRWHMEHGAAGPRMSETRSQAPLQKHKDKHSAVAHSKRVTARRKEAPNMGECRHQQGAHSLHKRPQEHHMPQQTASQNLDETRTCAYHQKHGEEYARMH